MPVKIEFHFDFGSPNAYVAHLLIPAIEARTGEAFEYVPVLLGGVFKATGNVSPAVSLQGIKNKSEYQALEWHRFLAKHQIKGFRSNPHFPVNTLQMMRGAFVAHGRGFFRRYVDEMYRHMWSEPKKMDDPVVFCTALEESGLPATVIVEGIETHEIKQRLRESTEASVARGVFGSPSFFVGRELYFGKDRLGDVEEEIERQKTA